MLINPPVHRSCKHMAHEVTPSARRICRLGETSPYFNPLVRGANHKSSLFGLTFAIVPFGRTHKLPPPMLNPYWMFMNRTCDQKSHFAVIIVERGFTHRRLESTRSFRQTYEALISRTIMEDAILSEVSGHKHLDLPGYLIFHIDQFRSGEQVQKR